MQREAHASRRLYPDALDFAVRNVLQPPSEQEMLDLFTRAEPK